MDEQELINHGNDADTLLKSEPFNRVVNKLVEQTFQSFVNSTPEQSKERSITYYHYRALVDVVNTLKQQVSVRDEVLAKRDNSEEEA
jgi:hypothetical protein|tara:strand:+ start:188 stop:448 length:261 start_codon:yes stop_codon:yes gene_type:complete